jgi:ParB family chromosome partitioning protein
VTIVIEQIPIEQLTSGRYQPRQKFDEEELKELAEAIKTTDGLLQPIIVRKAENQEQFEIIAGERRWRAAKLAGFKTVSCYVKKLNDQEALEAAIIENVSRTDLNVIEEAAAFQRLIEEFGYTHEEIATAVGKSRTKITNTLRMLKLDTRVQQFLIDGSLSEGHAKLLVTLSSAAQFDLAGRSIKHGWSVRKMEQELKRYQAPNEKAVENRDPNLAALERALSDHIGCSVKINCQEQQGKLEINFHNLDILEGLLHRIGFDFK